MRFRKLEGYVSDAELEDLSKTKEMFVDGSSASRPALQDADAAVSGDVVGICGYVLALGHTLREYAILADTKVVSAAEN